MKGVAGQQALARSAFYRFKTKIELSSGVGSGNCVVKYTFIPVLLYRYDRSSVQATPLTTFSSPARGEDVFAEVKV